MTTFSLTESRNHKIREYYFQAVQECRMEMWDGMGKEPQAIYVEARRRTLAYCKERMITIGKSTLTKILESL